MKKILLQGALVGAALLVMPGCTWFGGEETGSKGDKARSGEAVVKIGGINVLSTDDFKQYLDMLRQLQPGFEEQLARLPEEQQRVLYNNIIEQHVMGVLAKKLIAQEGWDSDTTYQATVRRMHDELDRNLAMMEIQKRIAERIKPSEKDAAAWYEQRRTTHPYMKVEPFAIKPEGIQAVAAKAKDEAQAKSLVSSAKVRGLKKAAAEFGAKADDLGIVTFQSTKPDRTIVVKIMGAQTFPTVDMVKNGDGWWVVESVAKKDAEFAPYEKVKGEIEQLMKNELFMQEFQNQMTKLKEQSNVELNDTFVNSLITKNK